MLRAIVQKIQSIWAKDKDNQSLKNKLIRGVAGSFGIKIAGSGLVFVMSIIFARFLGTAGLGTYSYAFSWANILSIPATLGIDKLIVREMAIYRAKSRWELMNGLLRWSNLIVLGFSLISTIGAIAIMWFVQGSSNEVVMAVILAMITIPIISLRNLRLEAMRGLNLVVLSQIPDSLFTPLMVIVLTCIAYFVFPDFNVYWVLGIKILAITATFFIGALWLWRSLPVEVKQASPQYAGKQWLSAALPFMFLGAVDLINSRIDILMLGEIKGVSAVGIYTVIVGITRLTAFIHQASLSVLAPNIATLYSEGKLRQLERMIQQSVLVVFLISLAIGVAIIGLGKYLLLIFGSEFVAGSTAMNILVGGQVFHALTGPVGLLLNMTGYQNYTAIAAAATAVLNIFLNALLIPQWGINGAAIATTTSLIAINILRVIFVQKKLNISLYFSFTKS